MTTERSGPALRRITGALFLIGALAFATAATILSATFDWPDILREPADVVLTRFAAGGPSLVWTWFATAWTYAVLIVPILLLPFVLGRRDDAARAPADQGGAPAHGTARADARRPAALAANLSVDAIGKPLSGGAFSFGSPVTRSAYAVCDHWTQI